MYFTSTLIFLIAEKNVADEFVKEIIYIDITFFKYLNNKQSLRNPLKPH